MNEFTKEELIALKNGIDYLPQSVNLDKKYFKMCEDIFKKLESMIDEYCEHQKDVWPLYTITGDLPSAAFCYECNSPVDKELIDE